MSPTLFLIVFNELIKELREAGYDVLAYADDLGIIGEGNKELTKAIEIVEEWTDKAKMVINKKKSGILFVRKHKMSEK